MQPTLLISANWPGMIYLNGRFAGECSAEEKLVAPVSPQGSVYLEYRPLTAKGEALNRKIRFAEGKPSDVPEDVWALAWPGGAVELELFGGEEPAREEILERIAFPEGTLLMGREDGEQTAIFEDINGVSRGKLRASNLRLDSGRRLTAVIDLADLAGHARIEHWAVDAEGFARISSENAWMQGAPHWPLTPENTALCALEAEMLGLCGEAENYLAPELRNRGLLEEICRDAIGCGPMLCAHPDGRSAVALFFQEAERLAVARPVWYHAVPAGGRQGPWQIARIDLDGK